MKSNHGSHIITYVTTIGFLIIILAGYLIFYNMNQSMRQQQKDQFYSESQAKIKILNDQFSRTTQNFQVYAQLPSFRSIRFYTLTLNNLAVEESKRQLELFFFDIHKNYRFLNEISFIDNSGNEIFKINNQTIEHKLKNISLRQEMTQFLGRDLNANETFIQINNDSMDKPDKLIWWIPVYVSTNTRLGYLTFKVDAEFLQHGLTSISEPGLNYIAITNEVDKLLEGEYRLITEPLPEHVPFWHISEKLALSGLNWSVNIVGNELIYTAGVNQLENAANFGFIPASLLFLILIFYLFRKKEKSDKQIHQLAYFDSLTGLVNRHQFDQALKNSIEELKNHKLEHALLYLDLDQFKVVNDTCGHLAGDKMLEELSVSLKHSVRESDLLARLGGDEFALLLKNCPEEKVMSIANKVLDTVSDFRFIWKEKYFSVGVSIGMVFINSPNDSASNVLRKADMACYMAKELGRHRIHIYNDEDQTLGKRHDEMQWVSRIKEAIENDHFFLVAQQIVCLNTSTPAIPRYEILIRLNDNGNLIFPDSFIPAAERYELMLSIDKWVIEHVFAYIKQKSRSKKEKAANFIFSINLSGLSLGDKELFTFIEKKMNAYHIQPESICFEITETAAITNLSVAMEFIHNVKKLGCSLALDDFGSGLCSFSYLKTIPVDYLKIDGSFVTKMLESPLDMAIVQAIKKISLATNSKVIAEFVSSVEIKEKLQELEIDYAQGYAIAKPEPLSEIIH